MNKSILIAIVISLIVGAGAGYALAAGKSNTVAVTPSMDSGHTSASPSMDSMMQALDGKTGDAFDQAFIAQMTMHHQGAIEMAQLALKNAKHQEIKDLAQNIITAQQTEIKQMQDWQTAWYGTQSSDMSGTH